ncbi:TPA: capsid protein [Streptococcus pyogenes]|jgi:hypothetical protein|nr:capsid protein [Streptococcus pyogenes]
MSFFVRTKTDISRVEKKVSNDNILKGKRALANQVLLDADKYIPKEDGALRASGQTAIDGSNVSWNTVYARAQYYGTNGIVTFNHYTTSGTGKLWYDTAQKANSDKWKRVAAKGMGL